MLTGQPEILKRYDIAKSRNLYYLSHSDVIKWPILLQIFTTSTPRPPHPPVPHKNEQEKKIWKIPVWIAFKWLYLICCFFESVLPKVKILKLIWKNFYIFVVFGKNNCLIYPRLLCRRLFPLRQLEKNNVCLPEQLMSSNMELDKAVRTSFWIRNFSISGRRVMHLPAFRK